jgi:hypothetical protein
MPILVALVVIASAALGAWIWRTRYRALRAELVAIRELVAELVRQGEELLGARRGPSDPL